MRDLQFSFEPDVCPSALLSVYGTVIITVDGEVVGQVSGCQYQMLSNLINNWNSLYELNESGTWTIVLDTDIKLALFSLGEEMSVKYRTDEWHYIMCDNYHLLKMLEQFVTHMLKHIGDCEQADVLRTTWTKRIIWMAGLPYTIDGEYWTAILDHPLWIKRRADQAQQLEHWVAGNPVHIGDQCCPDFSCCGQPMWPLRQRQEFAKASPEQQAIMCMQGLGKSFANQDVYVAGTTIS